MTGTRISRRELLAVTVIATAVTLLWLAPLLPHLGSAVLSRPNDGTATMGLYRIAELEHKTPFTLLHNPYAYAPEGTPGGRGTITANAVQPAFVWTFKHFGGLVAAWNVFLIVGFVLSATLMYVLLRTLGATIPPASFGAYVFGFSPFMFEKANAGHYGLAHTWVFPLTALLLIRRERRPTVWNTLAIGAAVAVAAYVHTYYLLIDGFLVFLAYLVTLVGAPGRRKATLAAAATSFGAAIVLLVPAVVAQHLDSAVVSVYSHNFRALQQFGANPLAYLFPPKGNPAFGWLLSGSERIRLERTGEPNLFFGWTTLALAATAVVMLVRRRWRFDGATGTVVLAAVLVPAAFYMSLPRLIHLGPLTLPAGAWFAAHVTTVFRVFARFGVLVGFGLVILATFALDRLTRDRRYGAMIAVAVTAFAALELAYQVPAQIWRTDQVPAYDRYLRAAPRGIVAYYPAPNGDAPVTFYANQELWYQTATRQRLFFSQEPSPDDRVTAIRAFAAKLEQPLVPGLLAAEHVRYVVIDTPVYTAAGLTVPQPPSGDLRLLTRADGASIYRVTARPANLEALLHTNAILVGQALWGYQADADYSGDGFYGPEDHNGATWRWLKQDGKIHVRDVHPGLRILQFHAFSAGGPRTVTVLGPGGKQLGSATVPTFDQQVSIGPFRVPGGAFDLTLHVSPGPAPLGGTDTRTASMYVAPLALIPYADYSHGGAH